MNAVQSEMTEITFYSAQDTTNIRKSAWGETDNLVTSH